MGELRSYQFPVRVAPGVAFGLSVSRLIAVGVGGVVFVTMMTVGGRAVVTVGTVLLLVLAAASTVRIGGRYPLDWLPVWVGFGWAAVTGNNEFYTSPDVGLDLPAETFDLPGELFGLELHEFTPPATARPGHSAARYGVIRDTFRNRLIAVVEVSGEDFLFLDADDAQARIAAWGATLDHLAQSLPEIVRLQVIHTVGPAATGTLSAGLAAYGGRGSPATAASYRQVLDRCGAAGQQHRCLLAVALDVGLARRAVRQAGGGLAGGGAVLIDRAAAVEDALAAAGLEVHGWLSARQIAQVLTVGFDPDAHHHDPVDDHDGSRGNGGDSGHGNVNGGDGGEGDGDGGLGEVVAGCGPAGLVDGWSALRHPGGWSTSLQVVRPPSRPVTGDFLQHLLIGVPAVRRMSLLYVPTAMHVAERRAQSQQVSTEAEAQVRARWGFGLSARHRREHADAAAREAELVAGRAVFRVVWLVTVTAPDPAGLDTAVGQVEAAARRCGLELRRLVGTQRQAAAFTLPLCRGAR
jgi:hypothetical protein